MEKEQLETKHDDEVQELKEKQAQEVHELGLCTYVPWYVCTYVCTGYVRMCLHSWCVLCIHLQVIAMDNVCTYYFHCTENAHSQKLMNEYEKYQELQARNQKLQEDYERQLSSKAESHEKAQVELTEFYEGRLLEKAHQLEQVQEEQRLQQKEADEMRRQIEEDGDQEILDLRNRYERKLREEKEENIRLRGDYGIMKKKVRMYIRMYICTCLCVHVHTYVHVYVRTIHLPLSLVYMYVPYFGDIL